MIDKIKKLLITSRPISWINTAYPFAAAYLLTVRKIDGIFIVGTIFYLIPYNLLMYGINDVFDFESDQLNPRKGGLEGAKLDHNYHRLILYSSIGLSLPFVVYLLIYSPDNVSRLILIINLFLVLAYSLPLLRFKEKPFLDSITSSSHFFGPMVYALSFSGFNQANIILIIAFFLWGMASHAFGAVQDIIADRQAHIGSIATVIGAKNTVRLSILLYLAAGVVLVFFDFSYLKLIVGTLALIYIINILEFINVDDQQAEICHQGWRRFIKINWFSGFVITMVLIYAYGFIK